MEKWMKGLYLKMEELCRKMEGMFQVWGVKFRYPTKILVLTTQKIIVIDSLFEVRFEELNMKHVERCLMDAKMDKGTILGFLNDEGSLDNREPQKREQSLNEKEHNLIALVREQEKYAIKTIEKGKSHEELKSQVDRRFEMEEIEVKKDEILAQYLNIVIDDFVEPDENETQKRENIDATSAINRHNRWDETPETMGSAPPMAAATPSSLTLGVTPMGGIDLPTPTPTVINLRGAITSEQYNLLRWEKDIKERNRPLIDEELDVMFP